MLRFDTTGNRRPPNYQSRTLHLRMLLAVAVIGGAMLLAGSFLAGKPLPSDAAESLQTVVAGELPEVDRARLASVVDKAPFRDAEEPSWFYLLGVAQQSDPQALIAAIDEPITYAQLVSQPAFYRGRGVRIAGSVRRIEQVTPAENAIGIDRLYRVTIWPSGGQVWPVLLYCLELPPGIVPGDDLAIQVDIAGYFYKNLSYAWEEGVGLAPVLLARSFVAPVGTTPPKAEAAPTQGIGLVVGAAAVIAACLATALWAVSLRSNTPRPAFRSAATPSGAEVQPGVGATRGTVVNRHLAIVLATLLSGESDAALSQQPDSAARLSQILELSDWSAERCIQFPATDAWEAGHLEDATRLAQRLARIDQSLLSAASQHDPNAGPVAGQAYRFSGAIKDVSVRPLDPEAAKRLATEQVSIVRIENEGSQVLAAIPGPLPACLPDSGIGARVEVVGIAIGPPQAGLSIVAPRLRWTPEVAAYPGINLGEAVLGAGGYDVALLHTLADARPISGPERAPFFDLLAAARGKSAGGLSAEALANLPSIVSVWQDALDRSIPEQRAPEERARDERAPADERRRRLLAQRTIEAAQGGRFSVAPLFLDSAKQRGELVSLDGVARRAVRIETGLDAEGGPSDTLERWGMDHYYEIDFFTDDSENLPLVCCVPSLPEGFPLGDDIRQPMRFAGFFFKRWLYQSRRPAEPRPTKMGILHDALQAAPLLIGPQPIALRSQASAPSEWWQAAAGGGFVLALALIWGYLWQASRARPRISARGRDADRAPGREWR